MLQWELCADENVNLNGSTFEVVENNEKETSYLQNWQKKRIKEQSDITGHLKQPQMVPI